MPVLSEYPERRAVVTSYAGALEIGKKPVLIGERINPTGKKRLKQAMDEYEEWLQIPDKKLPERIKRQREYVIRLDVPEKVKAMIYYKCVSTGFMGRRKEVAPKINVEIRL